jgi:sugar/nucleoside kinase (ribokinase family)
VTAAAAGPGSAAGARPVIIVGNLTIDDVIQPDGSSQMGTLGGNSVHACAAALTWVSGVGIVARCGTDFPAPAIGRLREAGADTGGIRPIDGPTVRNWVIYEADGSRNWVYRTPPGRSAEVAPQPGDIPAAWLGRQPAPVVHVAAMPLAAAAAIVSSVRDRARGAAITLDTHEGWRRGADVLDAARLVDVFLPSREELAELVGYDDPPRAAGELTAAGVTCVVVKMGGDGALVARPGMPLAHAPASKVPVMDPTGAAHLRRVRRRARLGRRRRRRRPAGLRDGRRRDRGGRLAAAAGPRPGRPRPARRGRSLGDGQRGPRRDGRFPAGRAARDGRRPRPR